MASGERLRPFPSFISLEFHMPRQNIVLRATASLFLICIVTLAYMCMPAGAVSVNLPRASESCAVPVYEYGKASPGLVSVEAGGAALAGNNVG